MNLLYNREKKLEEKNLVVLAIFGLLVSDAVKDH